MGQGLIVIAASISMILGVFYTINGYLTANMTGTYTGIAFSVISIVIFQFVKNKPVAKTTNR